MLENRTDGYPIRTIGGKFKGQELDLPSGITKKESHIAQTIYKTPDIVEKCKKEARDSEKIAFFISPDEVKKNCLF